MAIQHPNPTNIYLTYKVFQLIEQFRRRLRPRVLSDDSKISHLGSKTCLALRPFQSIEKSVARVSSLGAKKQLHCFSNRVCKNRKNDRRSLKLQTSEKSGSVNPNTSGEDVQHMFTTVDGSLSHPDNALSAIAADDKLFLGRNAEPNFDGCSLKEIIQYLVLVHDAVKVLYYARSQYDDQWLIGQGGEIGLNIDEAFIANYEHLLLRLQSQLVDALTRKVIEALIGGGQDKKQRKLLSWFAEFPNNRHPLNTTWPWSIKPSLAVLWGVCWMFYDSANPPSNHGNRNSFNQRLIQSLGWNTPQPRDYFNYGQEALSTIPQQQLQQHHSGGNVGSGLGEVNSSSTALGMGVADGVYLSSNGHVHLRQRSGSQTSRAQPHRPLHRSANGVSDRRPVQGNHRLGPSGCTSPSALQYNYALPSHAFPGAAVQDAFAPDFSGIATATRNPQIYAVSPAHAHADNADAWFPSYNNQFAQQHQVQQHSSGSSSALSPHASEGLSHLTVPNITVTAQSDQSPEDVAYAPPHSQFEPFYTQSLAQHRPQAPQHSFHPSNIRLDTHPSNFTMGNCPPGTSPVQTQQKIEEPQATSTTSTIPITPVSMSDPRSPIRSRGPSPAHPQPRLSDIKVFGLASAARDQRGEIEDSSSSSSQDDAESIASPRANNTYKRTEEPPKNAAGKLICKYSECSAQVFDRKCEWNKHMDKHDRPYKCTVKGCEKLLGFTYSGGLLRHEREVHKLHGGQKTKLYCPHQDCKRSSGEGFTRKENLHEHIRRVHRRLTDLGNLVVRSQDLKDRSPEFGPEGNQKEVTKLPGSKRKRESIISEDFNETDLRAELKRLKRENEEKDARLQRLEAEFEEMKKRAMR